ncbi:MAG TPA: hypothetical protein VJH91_03020 [Candidatus Paceibacterota bacterium]
MGPSSAVVQEYGAKLIKILDEHNPQRDVSYRAEGTLEAVTAFVRIVPVTDEQKEQFAQAIHNLWVRYKQTQNIRVDLKQVVWPSNRFGIAALTALGYPPPIDDADKKANAA